MENKPNCACGTTLSYQNCCGIIHKNIKKALTAESLMRSRYTAFTLANGDYLMESHATKTRNLSEKKELVDWAKSVNWVKLEIINTTKGLATDTEGTVAFKAFYFEKGQLQIIQENSFFQKEKGAWVYVGEV